MRSRTRQRDTIATVPLTPKALLAHPVARRSNAAALVADVDEDEATQPIDLGHPMTLSVPALSNDTSTQRQELRPRNSAAPRRGGTRGRTAVAPAVKAASEQGVTDRRDRMRRSLRSRPFTQPLAVTQARPRLWTVAASAAVVVAVVFTVLELAL